MLFVVLEAIEVLVAFAAIVAAIRLVFFHAQSALIWYERLGVNYREGSIFIGS